MIKEFSKLFGETIRANGYNLISFTDPLAALEVIKKHHEQYSLVILNYKRPQMIGCEFVKNSRNR